MFLRTELVARIDAVSALKPIHRPVKFEKEMAAARKQLLEQLHGDVVAAGADVLSF